MSFPPNVPLKVLIGYVSQRLGINILYDQQVANKRITLITPNKIPVSSLMAVLQSALQMKGLVMMNGKQKGWKKVVAASDLQAISQKLETFQKANGKAAAQIVTEVFRLKYATASTIKPVIRPFLTQPGANTISLPQLHVLIVTDFASNLPRLTKLIHLADQPPEQVDIQFVPAKHVAATKLAQQLKTVLQAKSKIQNTKGAATLAVEADPRTNRLILVGIPADVRQALELVQSMDVSLGLVTDIYQFSVVSPERIDKLVKQLIGPLAVGRLYRSAIDTDANLLVVTATPAIQKQVAALKEKLDKPIPESANPVRFYKLMNTSAADVLATIQQLETTNNADNTQNGAPESSGPAAGGPAQENTDQNQNQPAASAQPAKQKVLPTTPSGPNRPPAAPGEETPQPPSYHGPNSNSTTTSHGAGQPSPVVSAVHTANATVVADEHTNSIIVIAPPAQQQIYAELIKKLDQREPQVLIQTTIVTLDTTGGFSLGVELSHSSTSNNTQTLTFSSFGLSTVNPSTGALTIKPGLGFNGAILSSDLTDVIIRALQTSGRAKVLSAPQILVDDNSTGTISTVNEEPFTSVNASTTVSTTSFAGFVSAGTKISMTPHISQGDYLRLKYAINLSSFKGSSSNGVPPPRQTNNVNSEAFVPNGDTIVVGGINRQDFSSTVQAIPLLGDIPIIKHLFSNMDNQTSKSTLFVFIHPVILRDNSFRDLKYLSKQALHHAGLPSGTPSSEPLLFQ